MNNFIECPLCKCNYRQLTNSHFKRAHNTTNALIKQQFPNLQLKSDSVYAKEYENMKLKSLQAAAKKKDDKIQRKAIYYQTPKLCKQCNQPIPYEVKTYNDFCSHRCSALFNKSHLNFSVTRNKAEIYLEFLIRNKFPNLTIDTNNRQLLNTKYEIDILLPTVKLAIELNGPIHYIPYHGDQILKHIQNKDLQKSVELQKLQYTFLVLDISKYQNFKKTVPFLDNMFTEQIIPYVEQYKNWGS